MPRSPFDSAGGEENRAKSPGGKKTDKIYESYENVENPGPQNAKNAKNAEKRHQSLYRQRCRRWALSRGRCTRCPRIHMGLLFLPFDFPFRPRWIHCNVSRRHTSSRRNNEDLLMPPPVRTLLHSRLALPFIRPCQSHDNLILISYQSRALRPTYSYPPRRTAREEFPWFLCLILMIFDGT